MAEREYVQKKSPTPIPAKHLLRAEVQRIVALSPTFDQLHANADAAGISIAYKADDQGNVLGVSFSQDGVSLRGKHAGFTFQTLVSLYGQPNPTIIRSRLSVASRVSTVDCGKRRNRTFQTRSQANRSIITNSGRPTAAGRGHTFLDQWCEATLGALMPHTPTTDWTDLFLSLTNAALWSIGRSDGRRWHATSSTRRTLYFLMTPTPSTPDNERILEVLSAHIASNTRVAEAIDRFEKNFPTETQKILREHRTVLAEMPPPKVVLPESNLPAVAQNIATRQNIWGTVLFVLIVALGCFVLLSRR
jgi:hypothetical protein